MSQMPLRPRAGLLRCWLIFCLGWSALTLSACGGGTGGALISLPFFVGGAEQASAGPLTFQTPTGWQVTLEKARIALGPYYFNVSPPPSNAFRGGTVIVQATSQVIVDPLDPTLKEVPGGADGETGTAVAAEIGLLPADGNASAADATYLRGHVGWVEGTATQGGISFPFAGPIDIDKTLVTPQLPLQALARVNGASVDLDFTTRPQVLEMRVDPTHWFDATDFSSLADTGGKRTWDTRSTFLRQLLQGVQQQVGVYQFQLQPRP